MTNNREGITAVSAWKYLRLDSLLSESVILFFPFHTALIIIKNFKRLHSAITCPDTGRKAMEVIL